jgi:putative transposase
MPADYWALQQRLRTTLSVAPVRLVTYCLMPTCWHLVVGPIDPDRLRRCLQRVTSARAHGATTVTVRQLPGIDDLIQAAREVERQALTAGLVRRAQDWPWGSLAGRLDVSMALPLVPAPFLESRAWSDYVNGPPCPGPSLRDVAKRPGWFTSRPQRPEGSIGV